MKSGIRILALGLGLVVAGAALAGGTGRINGDIEVAAGQKAGDLSTVNGDIRVGASASVRKAETVNGSIILGRHATARSLEAVNGDITLQPDTQVHGDVETVNGEITVHKGADVHGEVSNVSGRITLEHAHVGDGLETVAGDITVGTGSQVEDGIEVDKSDHGRFRSHRPDEHVPRIVIAPGATVKGALVFHRKVELYVSDRAQIGPVRGATVHRFSGARP